jgi:glycosyltransferase involved in cell wall biosynthesis
MSFLCHEFVPVGGGAASALDALTKVLAQRGHLIQILTIGLGTHTTEEIDDHGRQLVRFGVGRRRSLCPGAWTLVRSYLALRVASVSKIEAFSPNLLVAYFAFPAGLAALGLRRRLGIPLIVSLRGSDVPGFADARWGAARFLKRRLVRPVWKNADLLTANGPYLVDLARRFAPNREPKNLPNGIDNAKFCAGADGNSSQALRVLYVGQLIERKRCREVIEALRWLGEQRVPAQLTIVGDGPQRRELAAMIPTLPKHVEVKMVGTLARAQMPCIYREHDALVHLSSAEGVSNVILEAMASGLPIVCTRAAAREVYDNHRESAVFVESVTPSRVGEKLLQLARNMPVRKRLQSNGLRAAAELDWARTAALFESYVGPLMELENDFAALRAADASRKGRWPGRAAATVRG